MTNTKAMNEYQDLCCEVELKAGRPLKKRSDFEWLSEQLMKETHELVSSSTLMRLWGYRQSVSARTFTLDVLARYVGYADYKAFEADHETEKTGIAQADPSVTAEEDVGGGGEIPLSRSSHKWVNTLAAIVLILVGFGLAFLWKTHTNDKTNYEQQYILHKGQLFPTYESYLKLFGITEPKGQIWSQPVPHYNNIIIFGGQYRHHHWGNEGDSTDLLPTRTEHWHDPDVDPEVEVMQNRVHYYQQLEINRLAITFMKDLVDTGFVFCGVYRMSLEHSDTTHVVWERVAEECDLRHLEDLEHLRN